MPGVARRDPSGGRLADGTRAIPCNSRLAATAGVGMALETVGRTEIGDGETAVADASGPSADFSLREFHERIAGTLDRQIFFVGGAPKSGTTWLQVLLDCHPQVSCGGEGHFIGHLLPRLKSALESQNRIIIGKNESVFRELQGFPTFVEQHLFYLTASAALLLMLDHAGGKPVRAIGEKTPDNIEHFWWLLKLVPSAKFIHIVRDPRDCAVSAWFHNRRIEPAWLEENFATIRDFVRYYVDRWATPMREGIVFGARNPQRYLEFRYGDLLEDAEKVFCRVLDFLACPRSLRWSGPAAAPPRSSG